MVKILTRVLVMLLFGFVFLKFAAIFAPKPATRSQSKAMLERQLQALKLAGGDGGAKEIALREALAKLEHSGKTTAKAPDGG